MNDRLAYPSFVRLVSYYGRFAPLETELNSLAAREKVLSR